VDCARSRAQNANLKQARNGYACRFERRNVVIRTDVDNLEVLEQSIESRGNERKANRINEPIQGAQFGNDDSKPA
jgi:hypothetical protein